jgi:uncharacterized protein
MRLHLAMAIAVAAVPVRALDVPSTPSTYFTDRAGVVSEGDSRRIEARLAAFERHSGHQLVAVLFPSLEGEALEDFTVRCAERWKVGRKGLDDGLIFFAFLRERRMRLEVGYGLEERIGDARAARLLDTVVKPAFQQGNYAAGILGLADAVERLVGGGELPAGEEQRQGRLPGVLLLLVVLLLLQVLSGRRRSRYWLPFGGWGGFGGGSFRGGGGFSPGGGGFGGGGASGSW